MSDSFDEDLHRESFDQSYERNMEFVISLVNLIPGYLTPDVYSIIHNMFEVARITNGDFIATDSFEISIWELMLYLAKEGRLTIDIMNRMFFSNVRIRGNPNYVTFAKAKGSIGDVNYFSFDWILGKMDHVGYDEWLDYTIKITPGSRFRFKESTLPTTHP